MGLSSGSQLSRWAALHLDGGSTDKPPVCIQISSQHCYVQEAIAIKLK
ncbi:MAG TPA: hypothetical protein V6C57_24760 [Coleofasciculaceae cyanobacterium]